MTADDSAALSVVPFDRTAFAAERVLMTIGEGEVGGKGTGLLQAARVLTSRPCEAVAGRIRLDVPRTVVMATGVFDAFMTRNDLFGVALSGESDRRIAMAFQDADFPTEHVGDLMALVTLTAGRPLAVRSSSLLEDSLAHPFAGIYQTKMVPNGQFDSAARFRALVEAIKFVYASTYSHAAKAYIRGVGQDPLQEKMAVLIQEVEGSPYGDRFYPEVSGVFRSYSYYRTGSSRPDEGVVTLALGLGKTIMDGGVSWSYSPSNPKARPPFSSNREMLQRTQLRFWGVNLGKPPAYDPTNEAEYLVERDLDAAEKDGSLTHVASTYDALNDRVSAGVGNPGPRILDFAPIVRYEEWPITDACLHLLKAFREELGHAVEVEFAVTLPPGRREEARMAVLQVRPMAATSARVEVERPEASDGRTLAYSDHVMGNGTYDDLTDIVYIPPGRFDASQTLRIAEELETVNERLRVEGRRYLLLGFGRWGSSDPWLGIPVTWGQISGAGVVVESTLPTMNVEPSQGSHFFLNIESFRVAYFTVPHSFRPPVDWDWLDSQPPESDGTFVRHISLSHPLSVKVDGRTGRGVIRKPPRAEDA